MTKHYQVWLVLEEWDDDNHIDNCESYLCGKSKSMNKAMHLWATLEGLAVSIKNSLHCFYKARYDD
ncbi:hypothetical protein LCGC14_0959080 [marine sediment metagenome]|uniref:Uncharacterized protein n=1 Tax=marine sediment metagenome TaxID=412755 RepID=A0A0F9QY90_9ZZZZ